MAKGRKRKSGNRTKSGQLSRAGKPKGETLVNQPSEWVAAQRKRYGAYYNSALGRAYASGLLDDPSDPNKALVRYQDARKFAALYKRIIGADRYRCPLDTSPRALHEPVAMEPTEQEVDNHEWLIVNMKRLDKTGCRPFFDQLTSHQFTDYGPAWLDRLLNTQHKDKRDTMILDAALKAIDTLSPVKSARIVLTQIRAA